MIKKSELKKVEKGVFLMCSLFGIYDYKGNLNVNQLNKAVNTLAREAEIRGKDATGIAYNHNGKW